MTDYDHCISCGEGVHWNTAKQGWRHDVEHDHPVAFTKPAWEVDHSPEPLEIAEIPAPEQYAIEVDLEDERVPNAIRQMIKAAAQNGRHPKFKITYARGPKTHSNYGTYLRMVDSVKLVCIGFKHDRVTPHSEIVATWEDGKFFTGYLLERNYERRTVRAIRKNSRELKAALVG